MSAQARMAIRDAGEGWVRLTSSDGEIPTAVYQLRDNRPIVLAYSGRRPRAEENGCCCISTRQNTTAKERRGDTRRTPAEGDKR
jgi:hypothetical protein